MRPIEIFAFSVLGFVVASLAAEWTNRKVWPQDYPSQGGGC